jgi:hypothetical protein
MGLDLGLKSNGPVLGFVYFIVWVSEKISVAYWLTKITKWQRDSIFYGYYVSGWLAALLVILSYAPMSGNWGLAFGSLALYRLQDLLFSTIGDALCHPFPGSPPSKIVLVIINIIQTVTIFAIAFLVFTSIHAFSPSAPLSRFGHFYLSWSTLPPLGSGFAAETTGARVLVMIESGIGILLTVVTLSRFLSGPDPGPGTQSQLDSSRTRGLDARTGLSHEHKAHRGRPASWVAVSIIIIGFIAGGIAMIVGLAWWLFWTGAGIVVIGGIFALSVGILDDWD